MVFPLIKSLANKNIKSHHWEEVLKLVDINSSSDQSNYDINDTTLVDILPTNIMKYIELVLTIS
jgi:hypothetical protein